MSENEAISQNISKIHFSLKFFHFSVKETPDSDFFLFSKSISNAKKKVAVKSWKLNNVLLEH